MTEKNEMMVHKFVLSTKKVIYLREGEIEDMELAAKIAGNTAGDNKAYLGIVLQKELLKRLLVKVDNKILSSSDKEMLKTFLNLKEYMQALKALQMVTGDDDKEGNLTAEFVTIGSK